MAHEIMHLLIPEASHSDLGLMRGQWTAVDLRLDSPACLGSAARSMGQLANTAFRRAPTAGAHTPLGGDGRAAPAGGQMRG
jgi:hypothetical protein